MRKALLILALFSLFRLQVYSQTVYWTESFENNQGWTLDQNWSIEGGMLQFYWTPTISNFDLSAISPVIELDPNVQDLIVNQYLNVFGASNPSEVAEIRLITSSSEFLLWSHSLNSGSWGSASGTEVVFDISDFAGQSVQFKFRTFGPSTYQWNNWNVYSLEVTAIFQNDLAVSSIDGPNILSADITSVFSVSVSNPGSEPQADFTVSMFCYKTGNLIGTAEITEVVEPQQTATVEFEWTPSQVLNTAFYAEIEHEGDEFEGNNKSKSHFIRVKPENIFSVLVWDNDNGIATITCPDQGDVVRPTVVLTRALSKTGIDYQLVNALPNELNEYNIIFVSLGGYCLS
ncbi:MAG: hypothetical protein IH597_04435 [Bacteroidales bacterium]|nr:hypothetical protein [Bacteroidales bacterium]